MAFLDDLSDDLENVILSGEFSEPLQIDIGPFTTTTQALFDDTTVTIDEEGASVISNMPALGVHQTNVEAALGTPLVDGNESYVTMRGKKYRITRVEPDGTGFAYLWLGHAKNA